MLTHCPDSYHLKDIWKALDKLGVPDTVADHKTEEWKAIYEWLYVDRWIGDVPCYWCGLSCMDDPPSEKCPFCECPTDVQLSDDDEEIIASLTING